MSPDEAYLEKQAKAEEEKLQKKIQALSDSDRKEIYEKGNNNFTNPRVKLCFPLQGKLLIGYLLGCSKQSVKFSPFFSSCLELGWKVLTVD